DLFRDPLESRQSDSLTHGRLVVKQVGQAHALQNVVDSLLQHHPHRPDAATIRRVAPFFLDRMAYAVKIERLELRCVDYISDRTLGRRSGQDISATRAAGAGDDAGASKSQKNLLDVVRRKPFLACDLPPVHRAKIGPLGEVERANHAVLGPGRYTHAFTIGIRWVPD